MFCWLLFRLFQSNITCMGNYLKSVFDVLPAGHDLQIFRLFQMGNISASVCYNKQKIYLHKKEMKIANLVVIYAQLIIIAHKSEAQVY